ncbi:glycosyltransferase family 2 protein [Gluconobacter japonicus]|uniref:glycosyltransferase family 2 protein n=1 Tax=Gluconobacter japonicus TaxID=376620 RepID=UPI001B8C9B1B|nr:glycosyltransferase [Gluconobacter japonicus]MBS1050189.1 glycosyltransferase [Gluconobacter japonicus]
MNGMISSIERRRTFYLKKLSIDCGSLKVHGSAWNGTSVARSIRLIPETCYAAPSSIRLNRSSRQEIEALDDADTSFEIEIPLISPQNLTSIILSSVVFEFSETQQEVVPLFPQKIVDIVKQAGGFANLRVGLGITTWNRQGLIADTINRLKISTFFPLEIFVSDDGSSDATPDILKSIPDISWSSARNRGIAWNKNRALFYLHQVRKCDVVLLIEDDVQPTKNGWDLDWILASLLYGHVNHAPKWYLKDGSHALWHDPLKTGLLSGQCSGFTREALNYVGYMDTRFGRYGHEHVEHTLRMVRAGYGGIVLQPGTRDCLFFLINSDLQILDAQSSGNPDAVKENTVIFDAIWNETIYRAAWRNDTEMTALREEILQISFNPTSRGGTFHG